MRFNKKAEDGMNWTLIGIVLFLLLLAFIIIAVTTPLGGYIIEGPCEALPFC